RTMPVRTSHHRPDSDCSAAFAMVEASAVVIPAPRESPATSAPEADASPSALLVAQDPRKADLDRRVLRALRLEPGPQRKATVAHRSLRRSLLERVFA